MSRDAHAPDAVATDRAAAIDWQAVRLQPHMHATLRRARDAALAHNVSNFDGFGSFHSDDVEELIEQSASEYVTPSYLPYFAQRILSRPELRTLARTLDSSSVAIDECDDDDDDDRSSRSCSRTSDDADDKATAATSDDYKQQLQQLQHEQQHDYRRDKETGDGSRGSADGGDSGSSRHRCGNDGSGAYRHARRRYRSASPPQPPRARRTAAAAAAATASFADVKGDYVRRAGSGGASALACHKHHHHTAAATTTTTSDDGNDMDGTDNGSEPPLSSSASSSSCASSAPAAGADSRRDTVRVAAADDALRVHMSGNDANAHAARDTPRTATSADAYDTDVVRGAHTLALASLAAPVQPPDDGDDDTHARASLRRLPDATMALLQCLYAAPTARCDMGARFRAHHFALRDGVVFVNHGAFGSALVGALAMKHAYELRAETEVVEYVDRQLLPLLVHSTRVLAEFVHADARQLVLVQNATFALNAAMRLITAGDVVAFLDTEYLAVYKMAWFRCRDVGASLHEVRLCQYLHDARVLGDDDALTREVLQQLPAGCTTFIVDLISSTTAIALPVLTHLVPALRRCGVRDIIVDGAHGPLQVPLNFAALPPACQPSVFVGNLHKWFSAPKSVGFLWVRAEDKERVRSVVVSHGAGNGMLSEFIWEGTRDYAAYLCVPALVRFWQAQDGERVRRYCADLLASAAAMLTAAFDSRAVARHAPFMALVELPEELQDAYITGKYIQDTLHDTFAIEVPVKQVEGRYYVRLSAFVYNTPDEYVYLRDAVLLIARKWFRSDLRRRMVLAQYAATQPAHTTTILTGNSNGSGSANTEHSGNATSSSSGSSSHGDGAAAAATATPAVGNNNSNTTTVPCDERLRRMGGCGVIGLDPTLKRRKTSKFA